MFVNVQRNKFRCYKIGRADGTGSCNAVGMADLVAQDFIPALFI